MARQAVDPSDDLDNNLKCKISYNPLVPSTISITLKGYNPVDAQGLVRWHMPKFFNPQTQGASAPITVNIWRKTQGKTTLVATGTKSSPTGGTVNWDIFDNSKNDDGDAGKPTNESPEFVPNLINKDSYIEVKITPNKALSAGGGIYIFFPSLPTTVPQSYLLPPQKKLSCVYKTAFLSCYSYPEAGMILIESLPVIPSGNEAIFTISGFTNPPYVVDLHSSILLWTYRNSMQENEQFKYTDLLPLSYGVINDAYVLPYVYPALKQAVTYDWVFRLSNDVPANGKLVLYFPANYYDLQSSTPCPTVELVQGIEWIDPVNNPNVAAATDCSQLFATSIATISQVKPIKKDQIIVIRFRGVKNPSQEGFTPYFQIESRNAESYIIDRIQTISQVFITRQYQVGTIVFDSFYVSPDNGKMIGNYYLSFFPQNPIPANGQILVTFPPAEFTTAGSWPAVAKQLCKVGGSLKTYKSCVWSTGTAPATIKITLDQELEISPGMEPVRLFFPKIKNFNPELSSGVVKVTTSYDGLNIDDSGSDETNRKAATTKEATVLVTSAFDYFPRNEGNVATYRFTMAPKVNVDSKAVIVLEFPPVFAKGLGSNIVCSSPQIAIGALDILNCTTDEYKLNITNHKGWTCGPSSCSIDIVVFGIVNPNNNAITDQIGVYIFVGNTTVSEYSYGLGALAYTDAPPPLYERWATYSNSLPRKVTDSGHLLVCPVGSTAVKKVNIHFPAAYDTTVLSPSLNIKSDPTKSFAGVNYQNLSVSVSQTTSLVANTPALFELRGLSQPYDMGPQPLYIIELEDTTAKTVLAKTYPNVVNRNSIVFATTETLIKVNDEKPIYLPAGTITDAVTVLAAVAPPASDVVIAV